MTQKKRARIGARTLGIGIFVLATLLVVSVVATLAVTTYQRPSAPTPPPDPSATQVEFVKTATTTMFAYQPDTIVANIKTTNAMLCGRALEQYREITEKPTPLAQQVEESGTESAIVKATYAVSRITATETTVVAFIDQLFTQASNDMRRQNDVAMSFVVDHSDTDSLCITSLDVA